MTMKKERISNQMKNVAKISSGTMVSQIISIFTLPFITRMYGAEIIGAWTAMYAVALVLAYVCDLGLSQAIMVEEDRKVQELYRIISTISGIICIPAFIIVTLYYKITGDNIAQSMVYSFFVVVYAFTFRQVQTCYTWLNRDKQYSVLMKNPVINCVSVAVFSIVLGGMGFKRYGYFIGTILGQILTLFNMKRVLPRKTFLLDFSAYKETLIKYNEFVKYQMPAQFSTQLRQQLPNVLIGTFFGNTILGYFSISQRLISIPINLIGQALGKVFYQTIAEISREGKNISSFVKRNMNRAMLISVVPMILFAAYGDAAIVIFFGKEYAAGGTISRIIVFRSLFTFLSASLAGIDIVLKKQKWAFVTCVCQTILSSLSVIVAYYISGSIFVCTALMVITFDLVQIVYFMMMYKEMSLKPINYFKNICALIVVVGVGSIIMRYLYIAFAQLVNLPFFNYLLSCLVR